MLSFVTCKAFINTEVEGHHGFSMGSLSYRSEIPDGKRGEGRESPARRRRLAVLVNIYAKRLSMP